MNDSRKKLSWAGYATILRLLQVAPMAADEMAPQLDTSTYTVRIILNRMGELGLIHVHSWRVPPGRGLCAAIWTYGQGEDAPRPARHALSRRPSRHSHRPDLIAFAYIMRALAEPITLAELMEQTGSTFCHLSHLMKHCRSLNLVRVAAWQRRSSGTPARMFALGCGSDAPRPTPVSKSVRNRRQTVRRAALRSQHRICRALAGVSQQAAA